METCHSLRALAALTEDLGCVPSTHKEALDPAMNLCSGLLDIHNRQVCGYLQRKLIHIKEKQVFLFSLKMLKVLANIK